MRLLYYTPDHALHHFAGISLEMWAWLINLCAFLYMETPFYPPLNIVLGFVMPYDCILDDMVLLCVL